MESQVRAKVTAKLDYDRPRAPSPFKPPTSLSPPPSVTMRPKAKINSSATIQPRKAGATPSAISTARTTRAPSPFKVTQSISAPGSSSLNATKARFTARPNGGLSASPISESRQRSLTTISSDASSASRGRPRRGSVSSHHTPSPSHSELRPRAYSPAHSKTPSEENGSPTSSVGKGVVRVKSRLAGAGSPPPISISPSISPPLPRHRPARVPSISGLSIPSPLLPTNVNPAPASATLPGHQRFATTRESHTHRAHPFQPFPSNDDLAVKYSGYSVDAKIDPAAIPLPPQSPPMSALSFSSRSSASRSSASFDTQTTDASRSTAPALTARVNGHVRRATADRMSLPRLSLDEPVSREASSPSSASAEDGGAAEHVLDMDDMDGKFDSEDPERKKKAAAKSIRKIADLEITTRSLLAINATLEATKHRQAKEIRDLRRKLRESRLILPPPTYRAVKSSLSQDDTAEDDEDEDEDCEEDDEAEATEAGRTDATYGRVKAMLDGLLTSCTQALASRPEDFGVGATGSAKVLSAEEVRSWRGDDVDTHSLLKPDKLDARPSSPSHVAVPDSVDGLESEDEVEASLCEPSAPLPPITVTPSP